MIDAETTIYDAVIGKLEERYEWARDGKAGFSNDFVIQPEQFPWVAIYEDDNRTEIRYHDTEREENAARLTWQVDVWTNGVSTRKRDARKIIKAVDEIMLELGFRRTYLNNDPTIQDISIYRYIGRYSVVCEETEDSFIMYHRP